MKIVTITIDIASGDAEVDLEGFNGKGCAAIQAAFAKAMATTAVPPVSKTPRRRADGTIRQLRD